MLESIESEIGDSRGIGMFVDAENAAFLVKFVAHVPFPF